MIGVRHAVQLLLAASLLSLSMAARPLPDDREQPIHITADKAVRDEKRGVTIYSGNVQMRQGSMELDADSLTIFHEDRDANKIVARGQPAKMRQQPEIDEGLVHAHAQVITYYRREELVHLRTNAQLQRDDGTLVTGDSIDYFITRELVKAESDRTNEDNKVIVVIPPSLLEDPDDDTSTNTAPAAGATQQRPIDAQAIAAPAADSTPASDAPEEEAPAGGATQSE